MKWFAVTIFFAGFFGTVSFAVWYTKSAWCLWAFVLLHGLSIKDGKND